MEIVIPTGEAADVAEMLGEHETLGVWRDEVSDNFTIFRALLHTGQVEDIVEHMSDFNHVDGFHMVLLPVEATIPKPEEPEKEEIEIADGEKGKESKKSNRVILEELYSDIETGANLTWVYVITVILSSVVAAIGLMKDSVAIIIGAMVIAPLLGPVVAMSFSATIGDIKLGLKAIKATLAGFVIAWIVAVLIGRIIAFNPDVQEIATRTDMNEGDIVLALVAGSAGALAFTSGVSASLIGVMVAVALLPALVNSGLLAGAGYGERAVGALLLFIGNVICVNLAGVITFLANGIRPRTWWEKKKAKRLSTIAVVVWIALLLLLVAALYIWQHKNDLFN